MLNDVSGECGIKPRFAAQDSDSGRHKARILVARAWAKRGGATVDHRDENGAIVLTFSKEIEGKMQIGRYDTELRRMTLELFEGANVSRW